MILLTFLFDPNFLKLSIILLMIFSDWENLEGDKTNGTEKLKIESQIIPFTKFLYYSTVMSF